MKIYFCLLAWNVSFFICKVHSVKSCFEWKEKQFNDKWIFSVSRPRPSLLILLFSSVVSPSVPFRIREPTKEYREDHLILLDFVGYYLCKLIVHHCLWRERERVGWDFSEMSFDKEEEIKKISHVWWKDYRVVDCEEERNRWSISTIFVPFHHQQQFCFSFDRSEEWNHFRDYLK